MAAMEYEYDEEKSEATLQDRGIDFDFAARVFDGDLIEYEDKRHDYGERRYVAIGPIEGEIFAVVYTWRRGRRRIISARRASRRERDAYRRTIA
jgi:uncharacterized DUF497 family protein